MSDRTEHIAVIGAGIGGLTAATVLIAKGFRVAVYEQAPGLTEIGAGIALSPNACKVMRELGLLGELEAVGVEDTYGSYRHARTGQELRRTDFTRAREQDVPHERSRELLPDAGHFSGTLVRSVYL